MTDREKTILYLVRQLTVEQRKALADFARRQLERAEQGETMTIPTAGHTWAQRIPPQRTA